MGSSKGPKSFNKGIGKNTNWDNPLKQAKNGAPLPKPSISLRPKSNNEEK